MPTEPLDPVPLPPDWYEYEVKKGVDTSKPGLYEWEIEEVGSYIGKYKRITRPTKEYPRNINNLLLGRGYRKKKPDGFRRIHRALAEAHIKKRKIKLIILENAQEPEINHRERELIAERGALNGREPE
jgi:hypothetical protein